MNAYLILSLAAAPAFAACGSESRLATPGPADVDAPRRVAQAEHSGPTDWAAAVVAAKVTGALYRGGAFFPDGAAVAHPAAALP
jgi:hypothetical protein